MIIRSFSISFLLLICFFTVQSQESIPTTDSIEFINGDIIEGTVSGSGMSMSSRSGLQGRSGGGKGISRVKLCKTKRKDCQKYPITEINKITIGASEKQIKKYKKYKEQNPKITPHSMNIVDYYKVLNMKEDDEPLLCKLRYKGSNFEFYTYDLTMPNNKIQHERMYITKANESTIMYSFRYGNTKKNVKSLTPIFGDCSDFKKVVEDDNIHKEYPMIYFYQLADTCKK